MSRPDDPDNDDRYTTVIHWFHRIRELPISLWVLAFICVSGSAIASPDDLDPSFGVGGKLLIGSEPVAPTSIVRQADGSLVASINGDIWRLKGNGTPDTSFGNGTGEVTAEQICGSILSFGCVVGGGFATQSDGKILIPVNAQTGVNVSFGIVRLLANGAIDPSFGNSGFSQIPPSSTVSDYGFAIVIQSDGGIVVGGTSVDALGFTRLAIGRFLPNGEPDLTFGAGGRSVAPAPRGVWAVAFAQQADGKLLVVGTPPGGQYTVIVRFLANGLLDSTFANAGVYQDPPLVPQSEFIAPTAIVLQADGKIVVAGSAHLPGTPQLALLRLDADGSRDAAFGDGGQVVQALDDNNFSKASSVALDSQQRIVAVGTLYDQVDFFFSDPALPMLRIGVARFNADGSPDAFFGPHGSTAFWSGLSSSGTAVAIEPDDTILVGGNSEGQVKFIGRDAFRTPQAALFRLQGGDGAVAQFLREEHAIEYYDSTFGTYFISATPYEIAYLDTYVSQDWVRTGESFRVWTEASPVLSPVCRFFSGQTFAPKSSHFYTPYPDECAAVRAGGVWQFEGEVFDLELPQGAPGQGSCPTATAPLYRLYNNGQGGVPNHRYTDSPTIFNQMLAQGWTFEGEAQTKVFACVPAP
jgi:uncharacterized delta-60 repeat protein